MNEETMKVIKLERKLKQIKRNAITFSIFGLIASTCLGIGLGYYFSEKRNGVPEEMKEFITFYNHFKENYYEEVDDRTLLDGLYYGLTNSVNDNYTFYTSTVNNEYQDLSSSGVGLGIARSVYYGQPLITQVMRTGPASQALIYDKNDNKLDLIGLKKGDILIKAKNKNDINYYEFNKYHYSSWSEVLLGDIDSEIELVFKRDNIEYKAKITRGTYNVDKVELLSFENGQAVFTLNSFLGSGEETTPAEELHSYFENVIFKNDSYKLDNLVIDLRDNGGGYVNNCNQLLGLFLGANETAGYYQYSNGNYTKLYTNMVNLKKSYNDRINSYTFIINQNTASAAEAFVIGMQDSEQTKDKVKVVGETSFGKGIAQTFYDVYEDGSMVRYTFAKVCSPSKRSINKRGIVPDVFASYLSIQDKDEYDSWRLYVEGVNSNDELSAKEKALIKSRIELLISIQTVDLNDAIDKFQTIYEIDENGVFGEKTASKLGDLFFDYYNTYTPMNIYDSYVIGGDEYDIYSPTQMKCIKKQISLLLNKEFTSFDKAVREFQNENGLTSKDGLYDLETSYLLQGLMYDLMVEQEDSVLKLAKEIYGV
ncbi:MAG: hypothetical protein E7177_07285 [Erysipelotrichaceae bacterium]|nr:hypothetical protein [Erysipelotrichaceae bacterium]